MKRRTFITLVGAAAALPVAARAQQTPMPVTGYLSIAGRGEENEDPFRRGLAETGLIEGRNVNIEYRWAEGQHDRLPALAAELVNRRVNLITAIGASTVAMAAKAATSSIPIVFAMGDTDPVQAGVVTSLARPGGNITGVSLMGGALGVKRVGLLHELLPNASVFAVLANPNNPNSAPDVKEIEDSVRVAGLKPVVLYASVVDEFDTAFAKLIQEHANALLVTADPFFTIHRRELIALAARFAIPAIYQWRLFTIDGGMMSYGTNIADSMQHAGAYAGQILKSAKPAELPVLQPTSFQLVINLKTVKALGLTVPLGVQALADEMID